MRDLPRTCQHMTAWWNLLGHIRRNNNYYSVRLNGLGAAILDARVGRFIQKSNAIRCSSRHTLVKRTLSLAVDWKHRKKGRRLPASINSRPQRKGCIKPLLVNHCIWIPFFFFSCNNFGHRSVIKCSRCKYSPTCDGGFALYATTFGSSRVPVNRHKNPDSDNIENGGRKGVFYAKEPPQESRVITSMCGTAVRKHRVCDSGFSLWVLTHSPWLQ